MTRDLTKIDEDAKNDDELGRDRLSPSGYLYDVFLDSQRHLIVILQLDISKVKLLMVQSNIIDNRR